MEAVKGGEDYGEEFCGEHEGERWKKKKRRKEEKEEKEEKKNF